MAFDLLEIMMRLQGAREVQAQSEATAASIESVGTAATTASRQSAAAGATGFASFGKGMKNVGKTMKTTGRTMSTSLTLPILLVGGASIKMANDFDQAMTLVHTQAGASAGEVQRLRQQVIDFSKSGKTEFGPTELANALFRIESGGFRGAQAMKVLEAASKGAAVGQTDVEDTAKMLSAAVNSNILGAHDYGRAMGTLNAAIGAGQMRMEDLTGAMKTGILPRAKAMGLTLGDVTSALDTLTKTGMPAQQGATRLGMTFSFMATHTDAAKKALDKMGIGGDVLYNKMTSRGGLLSALELLKGHLDYIGGPHGQHLSAESQQAVRDAFGGGRSSAAILALLGHLKSYRSIQEQVTAGSKNLDKANEAQAKTINAQLRTAWAQLQGSLVELGQTLVPIVIPAVLVLARALATLFGWFSKLPAPIRTFLIVVLMLSAALGPILFILGPLITMMGALIAVDWGLVAAWLALDAAVLLIPIAIALIVGAIVLAYLKVKWFHNAVNAVFQWIKSHWKLLAVILFGPFGIAAAIIATHFHDIKQAAMNVFNWIKTAGKNVAQWTSNAFGNMSRWISNAFGDVKGAVAAPFQFIVDKVRWVIDKLKWIVDKVTWVTDKLPSLPGGGGITGIPGKALGALGSAKDFILGGQHGGLVPGWTRHDTVPLLGAGHEYMMQRKATAHYGLDAMAAINQRHAAVMIPPRLGGDTGVEPTGALATRGEDPRVIVTKVFLDKRQIAEAVADYSHDRRARR